MDPSGGPNHLVAGGGGGGGAPEGLDLMLRIHVAWERGKNKNSCA